jgi:hypothetical protein
MPALAVFCWFASKPTTVGQGIVWSGPAVQFTEPAGGSGSDPANQDQITQDVWLTRNPTKGLYNAALESGYTSFLSPTNTEWAYGALANYASLNYQNWQAWNGGNPPSMVGQQAVLFLVSDDIYIGIEFTSWGEQGTGGFTYVRTTVPEPSSEFLLLAGIGIFGLGRFNRSRQRKKSLFSLFPPV